MSVSLRPTLDRPGYDERTNVAEPLRVWVDQDLCTGDGLCVQYAPEVFEFDVDGLAYVKDGSGELLTDPGSRTDVHRAPHGRGRPRPPAAGGGRLGHRVPG
jgi:ferredoxin